MSISNFPKFSLVNYNGRIYQFLGFTRTMAVCALMDVETFRKVYVAANTIVDLNK